MGKNLKFWAVKPLHADKITKIVPGKSGERPMMNLQKLIHNLPIRHRGGPRDAAITAITDDSRRVIPGSLFVARGGTKSDGRRFIADAIRRGAAAFVSDQSVEAPQTVAALQTADVPAAALRLAMVFHDHPHRKLKLIGVTGTKGKTTTAYMIRHLIGATGGRCGMIGTVEIDDGETRQPANLTTPGALELLALMARMVAHHCDHCVMEVSSHALHQGRAAMLDFAVGAFTNLSGDHLDYHKTMEEYAAAKAILFRSLGKAATAVVNAESSWAPSMARECEARIVAFAISGAVTHLEPSIIAHVDRADASGSFGRIDGPWGRFELSLPLIGRHNVSNLLTALGVMHGLGCDVGKLRKLVAQMPGVPGRLQAVRLADRDPPFAVLVDYAHTDDALANVLSAMKPLTAGRLRVLFGCGGDRDATKRPRMAEVACRLADDVVITSDNPRTEDPQKIIADILAGVGPADRGRVEIEADRAAAIRRIIHRAAPGDVVILAGKGHEDYQIIGSEKRPFDDRLHAQTALEEMTGSHAGR